LLIDDDSATARIIHLDRQQLDIGPASA